MSPVWARLEVLVVALGQVEELVGLTDQPMRSLDELRVESVAGVVLAGSAASLCLPFGPHCERG